MTPAEALLRAAALVGRGWCQGHYATDRGGVDDGPCYDAHGAICAAVEPGPIRSAAHCAMERTVNHISVICWNEAPGRTQAEVVQALRAAAETCA